MTSPSPLSALPPLPLPESAPLPPELLEHFAVGRTLGEGGAAKVYEAVHRTSGVLVAIKVARLRAGRNHLPRFRREAQLLSRLDHPNVVRLIDWGDDDGLAWMAMERADGTVYQRMKSSRRPLPQVEALHYARQTATALQVVHAAGVVHRDVKPSNLLLVGADVRLADFGIARTEGSSLTSVGAQLGSRSYMAPEQFVAPASAEASADVYGLATSLYSMLTRQTPAALHDLPDDHARWQRVLDPRLRRLLQDCTQSATSQRPSLDDVKDLLDDLARHPVVHD